jgi:hypothetical protein
MKKIKILKIFGKKVFWKKNWWGIYYSEDMRG